MRQSAIEKQGNRETVPIGRRTDRESEGKSQDLRVADAERSDAVQLIERRILFEDEAECAYRAVVGNGEDIFPRIAGLQELNKRTDPFDHMFQAFHMTGGGVKADVPATVDVGRIGERFCFKIAETAFDDPLIFYDFGDRAAVDG